MFGGKQKCFCSLQIYRQCVISRRRDYSQAKRPDKVNVKSLFNKSDISGKRRSVSEGNESSTYRQMVDKRQAEATRSVLLRVPESIQNVCDTLQTIGPVSKAYSLPGPKDYLLVEFKHKKSVETLMQQTSFFQDPSQIAIRSRLLFARPSNKLLSPHSSLVPQQTVSRELTDQDYLVAASISDQMQAVHESRRLTEVGSRLRFLVCVMVRELVSPVLPSCHVQPFGSSCNGFGWSGCDLDMNLDIRPPQSQRNGSFCFLTKRGSGEERVYGQQILDLVSEMVRGLMPSTYRIHKVLNARIPIIKFHHEASDMDCDLASANISGTKMSELMYVLGEVDPRVRVLMSSVKQWARSCGLTHPHPGPWPSSFTLVSLLLCFLQSRSPPVLPSLRQLQELAGPSDHFMIDGVDYAFVTDMTKISPSSNTQSLEELLAEFFHYFASFDFGNNGLSLIEGGTFDKQLSSPMLIENPLEIDHNISFNVSQAYVTRLQDGMAHAVRCLETKGSQREGKPWGLMSLFTPQNKPSTSGVYNVAGLFEERIEEGEGEVEGEKDNGELNVEDKFSELEEEKIRRDAEDVGGLGSENKLSGLHAEDSLQHGEKINTGIGS